MVTAVIGRQRREQAGAGGSNELNLNVTDLRWREGLLFFFFVRHGQRQQLSDWARARPLGTTEAASGALVVPLCEN